ncbi:RHS repeat-associated core domain-containing protein [Mesonia sp. MT50]|uniref:RHS repeat-associated core domain-containing protein n=1 Tax=Mesonia profundi TaxID=3070998 RepID=A0ABU1A4G1_9FLAO|nr:RHS repeat-associated core domain-containing protein [Mesonia profundi]MDQ7917833.1 RHS repeat-associated core domain-containing protein [Mesonia profundi]
MFKHLNRRFYFVTFDAGGERIIKRNLNRLKIRSNAKEQEDVEEDNVMLYPSGLIIAKPDNKSKRNRPSVSYTKHYYVGSERVASKIGTTDELGGIPNVINTVIPNLNIEEIHYWSTTRLIEAGAALQSVYSTFNLQPPTLNPLTQYSGIGFSHKGELEVFYFHPDHLGSSSYITNLNGNVTQHMEYLPFGETLVDEHTNSNNSPFKFNGKELDEDTGNYYYSARYYNPKWSIWLSVDPMAEKYPSWSPYSYTLNNPVIYTDPTGMVVESPDTDYGLSKDGKITQIGPTNDDPDRLFALDDNGNKNTEIDHLVVNDKNVLSSLSEDDPNFCQPYENTDGELQGQYAITNNKKEALNIFKFAAKNNKSEWALHGRNDGKWALGTLGADDQSPVFGELGFNKFNTTQHYHNHTGTARYDFYPSGRNKPGDTDFYRNILEASPNAKFYIYMPKITKEIYNNVIPRSWPKMTREPNKMLKIDKNNINNY